MQTLSLARFRIQRPRGEFRLGGEYTRSGETHLLLDAFGSVTLNGPDGLFQQFQPGDLVTVEAQSAIGDTVVCTSAELVKRALPTAPVSPHAARFARFVNDVRAYFAQSGLTEIFTPTLVVCPGLEPSLEPFSTRAHKGSRTLNLYLPTSPEIHLKKAMARGLTDIFELKNCFRSGEYSEHHDHEFTMLEWYRGFADLDMIIDDLRGLIATLAREKWCVPVQLQVTDFATLFKVHLGFKLTPQTTAEELKPLCKDAQPGDTFADLFHRILIDKIEPLIAGKGPLVIRKFPPSLAALARIDEHGWADRFEFYWNGLEIANAFNEVTDPQEQIARWNSEQAERARLKTSPLPQDPKLIEALKKGLPPTGGVALGVERLYMACTGVRKIGELKLFSGDSLFD
jgi:elongation factor P--(R)-beta-lysine ligase